MKKLYFIIIAFFFLFKTYSNNIIVSNISVAGSNITFTLSWDNSWNTTNNIDTLYPNNWDAAWIFVKYQNAIDNLWKQAKLSNLSGDHTVTGAGGSLQVDAVSDSMGVFIRRTNPGFGNISSATVTLKMGPLVGTGGFNFKVFGVEMVYTPQSSFQLGDVSAGTVNNFAPTNVTAAIQSAGLAANALYPGSVAVPSSFPMGVNAYYMMKYEMSVEQWIDFLNTLTYDQQAVRTDIVPSSPAGTQAYTNSGSTIGDNIIRVALPGLNNTLPAVFAADLSSNGIYNEAADGLNIAHSMVSKADVLCYLDWSGLRPMTEFEFEKSCRGTLQRVSGEYAWGSTTIAIVTRGALSNLGTASESYATVTNGRAMVDGGPGSTLGPGRCGLFATGSTGRASSGAGYYGNMELSGNCWEITVWVDATGVLYTGAHGNGQLTAAGEADVNGWPNGNTITNGIGPRGGSFYETSGYTFYPSVYYRSAALAPGRSIVYGARGVRTAP